MPEHNSLTVPEDISIHNINNWPASNLGFHSKFSKDAVAFKRQPEAEIIGL